MPFKVPALSRFAWTFVLLAVVVVPANIALTLLLPSPASTIAACIFGFIAGWNADRIADVLIPLLKLPVKDARK